MESQINYTCIVCPQSCDLVLDVQPGDVYSVYGAKCKRGEVYAKDEYTNPMRMLTTTVRTKNSPLRRLPVISSKPVPKAKLQDCLNQIYAYTATAPIKMDDILIKNIQDTGADIQAARNLTVGG